MDTSQKESLYEGLSREIRSKEFGAVFEEAKKELIEIAPYPNPEALIGVLRAKDEIGHRGKNEILYRLIRLVQKRPEFRALGMNLLLVAMWPALEHTYYKLLPLTAHLADLFSEIYWAFIEEIERFNPTKRTKIAVNLQWNTEKRVRNVVALEERYQRLGLAYAFLESNQKDLPEEEIDDEPSKVELPAPYQLEKEIKTLLRSARRGKQGWKIGETDQSILKDAIRTLRIQGIISPDEEDILVRHAIKGLDLCFVARRMGIKEGTARVRYFRAREKLQTHLRTKGAHVTFLQKTGLY